MTRAERRNAALRGKVKGVWRGVEARYEGYKPRPGKSYKPNGDRECARRRRQMNLTNYDPPLG
jgi:hypothetical protein